MISLVAKQLTSDDWAALRFEAGQLFTPSTPINIADALAGRTEQIQNSSTRFRSGDAMQLFTESPALGKRL